LRRWFFASVTPAPFLVDWDSITMICGEATRCRLCCVHGNTVYAACLIVS
jgi:hypothetical protein